MGQTPILPAVAQNIIRFSTAPSLTDDLATESEVLRRDYDFFVRTVNECGGIDIPGKNYEVDIEIDYCDDCHWSCRHCLLPWRGFTSRE